MKRFLTAARHAALTLLVATGGGLAGHFSGLPAGMLVGAAIAVALAAMAGAPVGMPSGLRNVIFLLVGLSMGASVASDSLSLIMQWPFSIAGLVIELALIISISGWMLTRFFGLDRGTAYLSSFPGHLSFILGIASAGVGEPRQIVIIQVIRLLMLTVAVPIGAMFLPVSTVPTITPESGSVMDPLTLGLLVVACVFVGVGFEKARIPAGFVLGSMAAATAGKLAGLYDAALPEPIIVITFIATGALIGSRFGGITRSEFKQVAIGGAIATAITLSITTVMAWLVGLVVDMPFGQLWLGLSPGALEGMGALTVALGYDTAFVAAHHVIRLLILSFAIPGVVLLIRWVDRRALAGTPPQS